MIIYQTPAGAGFNPLFSLRAMFGTKSNLFALNAADSASNRTLACVNIAVSIALITFLSISIAMHQALTASGMLLNILVVLAWRSWSILARRKEKIATIHPICNKTFTLCLFTFEWALVFTSITLLLLYVRAAAPPGLLAHSLALLAGVSAAMLLLPLAQGSGYLLIDR